VRSPGSPRPCSSTSSAGIRAQPVKEALAESLEAAFDLGDLAKVEELLAEIEAMRSGELTPYVRAQGARFGARLAAGRGELERVEPGFAAAAAAAAAFRELSMPFMRAVTLLEHGRWLVEQGVVVEAEPLLDEAREVFQTLGATPWLEHLEDVSTGIGVQAGA